MPLIPSGVPGYYSSIGCAVSDDDGLTFQKLGQALTSQLPKSPQGSSDQGIGEGQLCCPTRRASGSSVITPTTARPVGAALASALRALPSRAPACLAVG